MVNLQLLTPPLKMTTNLGGRWSCSCTMVLSGAHEQSIPKAIKFFGTPPGSFMNNVAKCSVTQHGMHIYHDRSSLCWQSSSLRLEAAVGLSVSSLYATRYGIGSKHFFYMIEPMLCHLSLAIACMHVSQ
jgi:hypothetical protein